MSTSASASFAAVRPDDSKLNRLLPLLFGSTIFTSACLLFLVQPLISKMILPWFGGSAAVWVTAMLFFQTSLLAGYLYAHFLTRLLAPKLQVFVHTALLLVSLIALPIAPAVRWLPKPGEDPTLAVFTVLGTCVGLPYMLLSATSPLIQQWFSVRSEDALPYRYFALSNAGSLLALFAFPLVVEPRFTGHQQSLLWSGAFLVFLLLCIGSALLQLNGRSIPPPLAKETEAATYNPGLISLWTALAACASSLLLIVTNLLTQNIAPVPLLWVAPLGIYLLTFILCFDSTLWYRRWLFLPVFLPALGFIASTTHASDNEPLMKTVPMLTGALFIACMTCHGELARLKPAPAGLTTFYLSISVGGALGGLAVAVLAPRFFTVNYEYPIVVTASALILLMPFWRERRDWTHPRFYLALWLAAGSCCILLSIYAVQEIKHAGMAARYLARNFYGPLRIDEYKENGHHIRQLNHGTITHGTQILDSPLRQTPTTYYGRASGIGLTWRILEQAGPIKMGVIGLGTGTLAAYGRAGDSIRFYDINPLVVDIAKGRFTYISDSPAHVDISLGDARLSLERQAPQGFDILVIDAFSGDAIPVHLLTEEAFRVYWKQLKPDGVLAVHVSNRYLDLVPVVAASSESSGKQVRLVDNEDDDRVDVFESSYVLISSRPGFFSHPLLQKQAETIPKPPGNRRWTDDYSNLWQALKFEE